MRNLIYASFLALIATLVHAPSPSHAAACCTSAAAFGTGRLLIWESFAVGVRTSVINQMGDFDRDEGWQYDPDGYKRVEWRTEAWAIVGLVDRLSTFAVVPWVIPTIKRTDSFEYGYGLGDIQVGLRYQPINVGEYAELPALALIGTLTLPTGTPHSEVAANLTGRGAGAAAFGLSLEKTWMPWYLQLNLGVNIPFVSRYRNDPRPFWYGPGAQVSVAGGVELPKEIVLSVIGQWNWEDKWRYLGEMGENLNDHSKYKSTVSFAASWRFHPNFTIQTSLSSDIFIEPLSYGLPGNVVANFGVRYGHF